MKTNIKRNETASQDSRFGTGFCTFLIMLLLWSSLLSAETISGAQTYNDGDKIKQVNLSGLEWMRLDTADTGQLNRKEMEEAFNDSNSIFYGWRYATREETANLLRSLGTEYDGWSEKNLAGMNWFFDNFRIGPKVYREGEVMDGYVGWDFAYGAEGECTIDPGNRYGCRGIIGLVRSKSGLMYERWGSNASYPKPDSMNDRLPNYSDLKDNYSHLLVREPME